MKRSRFKEEQIIAILKEAEAGMKLAELVRKHGALFPHSFSAGSRVSRRR